MKKMTRRSFIKRSVLTFAGFVGASFGGHSYLKDIEPHWIQQNYFTFSHPNIPVSFDQVKIAQFSDTHLGFQFDLNELRNVQNTINAFQPDIICFTGDLIDNPDTYKVNHEIIDILSGFNAPLGKFCIYGNHDHGGYGTEIYKEIMEKSGFTLLSNKATKISMPDRSSIHIIGIDDAMLGKPDIERALPVNAAETFNLILSHAPDYAEIAKDYPVHLQLSGHSHGGQIQFPFLGALITPPFAEHFVEGYYLVSDKLPLYVNRGLGTTRIPYRLFSRPEISYYTLQKGELDFQETNKPS